VAVRQQQQQQMMAERLWVMMGRMKTGRMYNSSLELWWSSDVYYT
jgi:hypothetical protein